jgi:hypothetical protein
MKTRIYISKIHMKFYMNGKCKSVQKQIIIILVKNYKGLVMCLRQARPAFIR